MLDDKGQETTALAEDRSPQGVSGVGVVGNSMEQVFALARKVAPWNVSVLITGETGTGKELIARAIHRLSPRSSNAFVAFSCANLPDTLVDDELFGHERGAFTGATTNRRGRFEAAHGGTLFLDEIGDLQLPLQAKLLRVLQARTFERLGSMASLEVDVRLICATHRDLPEMVKQGAFREDLYHRVNVIQVHLPPLRRRRETIAPLVKHFLERFAPEFRRPPMDLSYMALTALEEYDWPGNVRQLENVIQRAVVLADESTIELWHLPAALSIGFRLNEHNKFFENQVREFKRRLLLRALADCGGSKAVAARALGLARGYLHRLINELEIRNEVGLFDSGEEPASNAPEPSEGGSEPEQNGGTADLDRG